MREEEYEVRQLEEKIAHWEREIEHYRALIRRYEQYIRNAKARLHYLLRDVHPGGERGPGAGGG
ncbi:hypothetical protein STHERM_c21300 [Spirochaeta thermophila DSM 6192]|uniref:Uncharacterized protein n=1 Tax=Winmispira thermophila (strain ATCC 49972 / DSM 6192 / RI 19.B1) TaxID=665571 RepID=E0RR84_WINT6|nr:hypothetical protein STHERM_c21300 [Spirochaeta thermophila DSM 6192]